MFKSTNGFTFFLPVDPRTRLANSHPRPACLISYHQRRLCNAAKKVLEKIPTKTLRSADLHQLTQSDFAECCAICIETFRISDLVRILPCR